MKDLLKKLLSIPTERINHPVFGPFILSWIAFNWEAIAYFFFHKQDMKEKIDYISQRYNNSIYLIWLPLASMLIYKLILPYLSSIIGYMLKLSNKISDKVDTKNLELSRKREVEEVKHEINMEILEEQHREQKSINHEREELLKQLKDKDRTIQEERDRYAELNNLASEDQRKMADNFQEERDTHRATIKTLRENLDQVKKQLDVYQKDEINRMLGDIPS
jgi:hypothetical protein